MSQYELAVVAALRAHAWLWLTAREVQDATGPHIIPVKGTRNVGVKRRVVRHHLDRLADVGAVEVGNPWNHRGHDPCYRWLRSAPAGYVEHLQQAARAAGRILPAVADPPTHCALGHAFTTEGEPTVHVFPDGQHGCIPCREVAFLADGRALWDPNHHLYRARRTRAGVAGPDQGSR